MDLSRAVDSVTFEVECPECQNKIKLAVGKIRANPVVQCANGHKVQIKADTSDLDKGVGEVNKAIKGLEDTIRNIGR
jgi:DNA-directed RNA polymerase subunit RPC12/RpoP